METELPIHNSAQALDTLTSSSKTSLLAWTVFFTGILYYCFAYLLRVYPSVMENNLLAHFNITASSFGVLTSFYYFSYAPMQLPVGVSVDKIGPRRSLLVACSISLLGVLIFAYANHLASALIGRFLIGFGAAFAYVTALKIATIWLPQRYFATATGAVTACGMIAAIFTDMYLTHLVEISGYKSALHFPIFLGIFLLVLIYLLVKNKKKKSVENNPEAMQTDQDQDQQQLLSFKQLKDYLSLIAKNPQMWAIGIVGSLLYLPASVFLDVWAIPYLETVYHLTPEQAAFGVSVMFTGWIASSFLSGTLSDLFGTRKVPLIIAAFGAMVISTAILYAPGIHRSTLLILLFALGAFCGPHPLCFTMSKENNANKISGTAIAFANFIIMMGGFLFQPVVGKLLDLNWHGMIAHGIRVYSSSDYTAALSIMPLSLLIAGLITLWLKETYHNTRGKEATTQHDKSLC